MRFDQIPSAEARRKDVRWVEPKVVIESHFRGWTADRLVRQAAFKGVREDKPPQEVVREMPVMSNAQTSGRKVVKVVAETAKAMTRKKTAKPKAANKLKAAKATFALGRALDGRVGSDFQKFKSFFRGSLWRESLARRSQARSSAPT